MGSTALMGPWHVRKVKTFSGSIFDPPLPKEYTIRELRCVKCQSDPLTLDNTVKANEGFCASLTGSGSGIRSNQLSSSSLSASRLMAGTFFSFNTCCTLVEQSSHKGYCSSRSSLCQFATCKDSL